LNEWPKLSSREFAKICAVNKSLVEDVRKDQLADSASCEPVKRVGADGKERRMPVQKPTPPPADEEQTEEQPEESERPIVRARRQRNVATLPSAGRLDPAGHVHTLPNIMGHSGESAHFAHCNCKILTVQLPTVGS